MKPLDHFNAVWSRCAQLADIHAYLSANTSKALPTDEILRAEWVARVSAVDLYVHELVAQSMLAIFESRRPSSDAFLKFQISNETLLRIRNAVRPADASAAFDLEIRERHSLLSFQEPEKLAGAIRLISNIELWNTIAIRFGATEKTKQDMAKRIKRELSLVVHRRNKIAHEGDLEATFPRNPWPINATNVALVRDLIEKLVFNIDAVLS